MNLIESIYLQVDFLVRISVLQEKGQDLAGTGLDSGLNISGLFAHFDPAGYLWRTCQGSLFEGLTSYSGDWPRRGMILHGSAYRLPTLERPIGGNGCVSWRTPLSTDGEKSGYGNLPHQVKMWPTPNVPNGGRVVPKDSEIHWAESLVAYRPDGRKVQVDLNNAVKMWPTPHSNCHTGAGTQGRNGGMNLQTAAQMWPTPRANKTEGYSSERFRPTLAQCATGQDKPKHGQLNPFWAECLMGFPEGWTDIDGQPDQQKNSTSGSRRESQGELRAGCQG